MRMPHLWRSVRRLRRVVAAVAISFAAADSVVIQVREANDRRRAEWCEGQLRRCKQIDAMDA